MNLSLPNDAEDMSADKAKAIMKNLWGKYKKAVSGWHASGNSQEGKAREGEKIILHINGTTYKPTAKEHEDESTQIKYVDDDRLKFCVGDLSTAYLWGMVEEAGVSLPFACRISGFLHWRMVGQSRQREEGGKLYPRREIQLPRPSGLYPDKSNRS
jgi:hypothetical protein